MKTTRILAAVLAAYLLAVVGAAQAADEMKAYVEGSYAWPKLDGSGVSGTTGAIVARGGVNFSPYWSLEGVVAFGTTDATVDVGFPLNLKFKNAYGAYVKGQYPVAPQFELFARAGWFHNTVEASGFGGSISNSNSSFSYGAGVQVPFGTGWYAQADYMSYYSNHGDSIKGPSLGVGYRF
jgi:outer membrane immunogenic protein